MRIFFASCTTSVNIKQNHRIAMVHKALEKQGHDIFSYIYDHQAANSNNGLTFTRLAEHIIDNDVYIAEMSLPSQTLGFQIAFALNNGKPCLYLFDERRNAQPDSPIANHPSRLITINNYSDTNLHIQIKKFMLHAKKQLTSRRISFMSTHEIDHYLTEASLRFGTPKSELIRNALHNVAKEQLKKD